MRTPPVSAEPAPYGDIIGDIIGEISGVPLLGFRGSVAANEG